MIEWIGCSLWARVKGFDDVESLKLEWKLWELFEWKLWEFE
jgi:hypothetical protein